MSVLICNSVGGKGLRHAASLMTSGRPLLDAIEQGIRIVEADPEIHSVGRGGWPNMLGQVELDASMMEGQHLRCGAVGAVRGYLHPISIARQVMERLPHVLLVGDGAECFAAECASEAGQNLTPEARERWLAWREANTSADREMEWPSGPLAPLAQRAADPESTHGTTVFLGRDNDGHMAVGVSTSGWAFKYPGRLGDSPIIGAGSYVDDRYGAAACIGQGELTIRAGTARAVVLYLKMGLGLRAACREALRDLEPLRPDLSSFVFLHAMSRTGEHYAVVWGDIDEPKYWAWASGAGDPELRSAEHVIPSHPSG